MKKESSVSGLEHIRQRLSDLKTPPSLPKEHFFSHQKIPSSDNIKLSQHEPQQLASKSSFKIDSFHEGSKKLANYHPPGIAQRPEIQFNKTKNNLEARTMDVKKHNNNNQAMSYIQPSDSNSSNPYYQAKQFVSSVHENVMLSTSILSHNRRNVMSRKLISGESKAISSTQSSSARMNIKLKGKLRSIVENCSHNTESSSTIISSNNKAMSAQPYKKRDQDSIGSQFQQLVLKLKKTLMNFKYSEEKLVQENTALRQEIISLRKSVLNNNSSSNNDANK